jgi:hypothetical protein
MEVFGVRAAIRAAALAASLWAASAAAEHLASTYCGTGIPPDEGSGFVAFPRGDVFCPLIADPKGDGSFASVLRGTSSSAFGTDIGSVGIGDRFALFRWNGRNPGEGVQLGLSGNVYAQFDLNTKSFDLINADYVVGLPVTLRWSRFSARLRLYHQSSHLGDEFVLRPGVERTNFAFESFEPILSVDVGPLRTYAGGEYVFDRRPERVDSRVAHGGVELRQGSGLLGAGRLAGLRLIAGLDVKSVEALEWSVAWSAQAGLEAARPRESERPSRRLSLVGEYYYGPSPYGQFFRSKVSYYGVGLRFAP